jgi:hypothetical protein
MIILNSQDKHSKNKNRYTYNDIIKSNFCEIIIFFFFLNKYLYKIINHDLNKSIKTIVLLH